MTVEKPLPNRTNGNMVGWWERIFGGNTEFEILVHENLILYRTVDNNTRRHIRGRDIIWGVACRTRKRHLHKFQCTFLLNSSSDTLRTGTKPAYSATKGDEVERPTEGREGSTLTLSLIHI